MAGNDLLSNLVSNSSMAVKKRKVITIRLLDESGVPTMNPTLAYKEVISIQNDIAAITTSRDYGEPKSLTDKKAMSIYGYQVEQEGLYKMIEMSDGDDIDDAIITNMFKITYVDFIIQGMSSSDTISRKITTALFNNFSCINIENKTSSTIVFPSGDLKLESFSITGGSITLEGDLSISSDDSNSLNSVSLISNKGNTITKFNLLGSKNYIYNVDTNQPIAISVVSPKATDINAYSAVEASINQVTYRLFGDYSKSVPKEVFEDALLTVMDVNNVKISDVSIVNGQEFKGIRIAKCHSVMMNNIIRSSDTNIYGYTIGLSDVTKTFVSNLRAIANFKNTRESYAIYIGGDGLKWNQSLSVSDFKVQNLMLINLSGVKADSLLFSEGNIATNTLVTSDIESSQNRLKFSDVQIYLDGPLNIDGKRIEFLNCDIKLTDVASEKHCINSSVGLKLDNTTFYAEIPVEFKTELDGFFTIKNSDIKAKSLTIDYDSSKNNDLEKTNLVDSKNRTVDIDSANIEASELEISGVSRVSVSKFSANVDKIKMTDSDLYLSPLSLVKQSAVDYIFDRVNFKNAVIESRNTHSSSIKIKESTGNLTYSVLDQFTDEDKIKLATELEDSRVMFKIDTVGAPVVSSVKSANSIGSAVFGLNSEINVVPSMQSKDISDFNNINSIAEKDANCVNYGNSSTKLSAAASFGLNT
jgi:hypothetical protein